MSLTALDMPPYAVSTDAVSSGLPTVLDAMLGVSRALALGQLSDVFDAAVEGATMVSPNAAAAGIFLEEGACLRLAASYGLTDRYRGTLSENPMLLRGCAIEDAMTHRRVSCIVDVKKDPRAKGARALVADEGIKSILAIPLVAHDADAVVGGIAVYRTSVGQWTQSELDLLRFFADHAAAAVQTSLLIAERAEWTAGLARLVQTLQNQAHEHANRLHAVHGLLALDEPDQAARFLGELLTSHHRVRADVGAGIGNAILVGLLHAETAIAEQRGIRLEISAASVLEEMPPMLDDVQLVTIVGNLLDNAFDAVEGFEEERRVVRVELTETSTDLHISVVDRGPGLATGLSTLQEQGESTKSGHVGAGLALVSEAAEAAMGSLSVASDLDGTRFSVTIPTSASAG